MPSDVVELSLDEGEGLEEEIITPEKALILFRFQTDTIQTDMATVGVP